MGNRVSTRRKDPGEGEGRHHACGGQQDGTVEKSVVGLPPVHHGGDAGLPDVALDPHFPENRTIYFRTWSRGVIPITARSKEM
ncbi:PQQ-dependent sugar dehydrogenase [Granulicella sibirica]|uniref:PQQ-dependent sugar dehydrogenase n=1 Tax=Granulicella sibirica TaxID=2479048 RepID=UPI003BACF146